MEGPSDERLSFGLIAQEVEPIMPQLVNQTGNETETLSLDYVSLVPVLVKAIQEQQDALNRKDAEIASLNARLTALEKIMEQIATPH